MYFNRVFTDQGEMRRIIPVNNLLSRQYGGLENWGEDDAAAKLIGF